VATGGVIENCTRCSYRAEAKGCGRGVGGEECVQARGISVRE
jgi:hypothetical protein